MNKEKMVKKIMESPITIDSIKEVLISELKDDRVECIGQLEDLKLHDVSYYIGEKLGEIEGLSNEKYNELYCHIFDLFCEENYNMLEDDEKNYNIKRIYLGHTSSFYIESNYHDIINYIKESDYVMIIMYSLDNRDSFNNIKEWMNLVYYIDENTNMAIIASKTDSSYKKST